MFMGYINVGGLIMLIVCICMGECMNVCGGVVGGGGMCDGNCLFGGKCFGKSGGGMFNGNKVLCGGGKCGGKC